jgi:6-phosphogluconolactonase (cycloisomerase 2 family)
MHRTNHPSTRRARRALHRTLGVGIGTLAALGTAGTVAASGPTDHSPRPVGHVYAISNGAAGNQLLVFDRGRDGSLVADGAVATGGTGTGAGLGTQGAVAVASGGHVVLAVDPGSDQISTFVESGGRLVLVDTDASGGDQPSSITVHGRDVYVLNAGAGNNVSGFRLGRSGLEPIPGSTQPLSAEGAGGAQVSFTPDGRQLVVTEKNTNRIATFRVRRDVAAPAVVSPSTGATPFGFAFGRRGELVVSNAAGGAAGASSVSTYAVGDDGRAHPLDGPVPTGQTSACWLVVDGRYAYTANTGSGTLSGFAIDRQGVLAPLNSDGLTATAGPGAADSAVTPDGGFLYERNGGDQSIGIFSVGRDGSLTNLGFVTGLPPSAAGLAVS